MALAANVLLFLLGSAAGATWEVGQPAPIGLAAIAVATLLPMLLGGLVVRAIAKRKPNLVSAFTWVVLVFSLVGAPGGYVASQNLPTGLALGAMHVVVGLVWFYSVRGKQVAS
ncbi:MAG: DUF6069 family protein [Micrococcales bacterium]